jgi:hypothetical protein
MTLQPYTADWGVEKGHRVIKSVGTQCRDRLSRLNGVENHESLV